MAVLFFPQRRLQSMGPDRVAAGRECASDDLKAIRRGGTEADVVAALAGCSVRAQRGIAGGEPCVKRGTILAAPASALVRQSRQLKAQSPQLRPRFRVVRLRIRRRLVQPVEVQPAAPGQRR
jgi:hypothetical protein